MDGPTILVQGGIQGDEISGVLTAEILLHAKIKKGNLIVIPRANVPAILHYTRGINVDLNRRFDKDYKKFYEDHLARAIKLIVSFTDGLIHLHEGLGFYSPVYIDELRNPRRFGQSYIIDTTVYKKHINLEAVVKKAILKLNSYIKNKHYSFNIFNTNTISSSTKYPEQRKSFSYYTLTRLEKPAFAIEVSKDIKNTLWKTDVQLRATQYVLAELGVDVELPDVKEYYELMNEQRKGIKIFLNGQDITNKNSFEPCPFLNIAIKKINTKDVVHEEIGIICSKMVGLNLLTLKYLPYKGIKSIFLSIDGKRVKKWDLRIDNKKESIFPKHQNIFV
ncbi:M99 family carboxypeptidase catalytic domain-containing protein, partial [Desulfothermus sp.]